MKRKERERDEEHVDEHQPQREEVGVVEYEPRLALVSGATFSSSGTGTCVVRASGAATTNFNAASNTQSVTIASGVTYTFDGFDDPYGPPVAPSSYNGQAYTVARTFKLGSTLPVKFGFKSGGVRVDSANANPQINVYEFACGTTFSADDAVQVSFTDTGGSTLTYDSGSKTWHRNLQLKAPAYKGDTCYFLQVTRTVSGYGNSDYTPCKVKK